jgi:hypothetical protein
LSNFLIIPYTKYCGVGWTAKKYSEIGAFSRTGTGAYNGKKNSSSF